MYTPIRTIVIDGLTARPGTVTARPTCGTPGMTVLGEPANAAIETRDRVRHAMESAGLALPRSRIEVDICPLRDARAETHDLATALAVIMLAGDLQPYRLRQRDSSRVVAVQR